MKLRPYQQEAIEAIESNFQNGINKQVIVLATGLGKTVIFSHLIAKRHVKSGKKALILAHREELLSQAKDKLFKIAPELNVQIEMAEQYSFNSADVVVASVATIGRSGSSRIKKFNPEEFDTIVIDEAHHASASTYKNVLSHFGLLKDPGKREFGTTQDYKKTTNTNWNKDCLLLGVTATPSRNDNEGIDQIFDEVVYNYGIVPGVQNGWLSRIRAFRVDTTTSLDEVHTLAGDFNQGELGDTINNPERNNLIVKTYLEQYKDKQALVFAIDVAHATALGIAFTSKGIAADTIDGKTPKDTRAKILENFHNKKIQVVINCMVLTEGYDNDTIDVIMMARPTKSGILYQQMVGRGTRTHEEKPFLTICDFVDNTYKHTIKTSSSLLGLDGSINFRGTDIIDGIEKIREIQELAPGFNLSRLDFNKLDYIMEEVDLLGGLDIPSDLKDYTRLSWHRYGENAYRIGLGESRYLTIEQTITGQWKVTFEEWEKATRIMHKETLGEVKDLPSAIERADTYIENNYNESLRLVDMGAQWRKDPPTEKQIEALKRLGVSLDIIAQLDKGTASQLQTKLYGTKGKFQNAQKISRWR